jgi:hypothetical protein
MGAVLRKLSRHYKTAAVQIIWQQQSGGVGGKFNVAGELSAAGTATSPCKYQLKIA